jgi:hypothetical protein
VDVGMATGAMASQEYDGSPVRQGNRAGHMQWWHRDCLDTGCSGLREY